MGTLQRNRGHSAAGHRGHRPRRVLRPVAGQCFEIEVDRLGSQWSVRIPEIGGATRAANRSAVESAARQCIAAHTGIPLGYISVWVRD